jgi:hypothetical protein
MGDIFARRAGEVFHARVRMGIPAALENPKPQAPYLSIFDLDLFAALAGFPRVFA